jgi:Tol biopolymer transport system component
MMKKTLKRVWVYMLLFFFVSIACLTASAERESVTYVQEESGVSNIVLYDVTTSETSLLTHFQDEGSISSVSTTQEGDRIIFTRPSQANGRNNSTVWSVNSDGSGLSDLITGDTVLDFKYAAVSPDGTEIVYSVNNLLRPNVYHLYIKTSTETRQLTSGLIYDIECAYPVFLDEDSILFLLINLVHEIYDYCIVNTDGSGLTNLTDNEDLNPYFPLLGRPSLNSDRDTIIYGKQVYDSGAYSDWQIYTMNINSLDEQIEFDNLYYVDIPKEDQPEPQPFFMSGGDIGFVGTQDSVDFDLYFTSIYSVNPYSTGRITSSQNPYLPLFFISPPLPTQWLYETNGQIRLRDENGAEDNIGAGTYPVFNWAGTFTAYRDNGIKIRRLGANSSTTVETDTTADHPAFSPDGRWLAYVKGSDIWARLVDMTNSPRQLTNSPLIEKQDLSFSPDGRSILFTGTANSKKYIYRMPVSITYETVPLINPTGLPVNLTEDTNDNYNPSFSPDGKTIVFVSTRNQVPELWLMNLNGTEQNKIIFFSSAPQNPAYPQFSPYDNNTVAYLTGTPQKVYTTDISQEFKSGNELFPTITTTGRFSWGRVPSESISVQRHLVFDIYHNNLPLEYKLFVSVDTKELPVSFFVEETVPDSYMPDAWLLTGVTVNGLAPTDTYITTDGGKQTLKWLFGAGNNPITENIEMKLTFDISGDTLGNDHWLTGGVTVSGKRYLTAGDSHITIGEPFIPVDINRDNQIDEGELLYTIDLWAGNLQIDGWPIDTDEWDFWLLKIINFWVNGNYNFIYTFGDTEPMWGI